MSTLQETDAKLWPFVVFALLLVGLLVLLVALQGDCEERCAPQRGFVVRGLALPECICQDGL